MYPCGTCFLSWVHLPASSSLTAIALKGKNSDHWHQSHEENLASSRPQGSLAPIREHAWPKVHPRPVNFGKGEVFRVYPCGTCFLSWVHLPASSSLTAIALKGKNSDHWHQSHEENLASSRPQGSLAPIREHAWPKVHPRPVNFGLFDSLVQTPKAITFDLARTGDHNTPIRRILPVQHKAF